MRRISIPWWLLVAIQIFILLPSAIAQQATVRGFVTDESSEEVLQGASVVLLQYDQIVYGEISDADGFFLLHRISPGHYTLRVSFVGFEADEKEIDVASGRIIELSVVLSPVQTMIDEIVIEAEKARGATAVIAGLESVVPADMARVPIPGMSGDLAAYLQTLPGVVVQGDRGGQIFVRGGAVDQNLAFLDGLPVYMPFHILSFYSAFPEDVVNRAEFFTGGYGAEYGSRNASILDVRARNGNKQNLAGSVGLAPFLSEARIEGPIIQNRASIVLNVRQSLIEEVFPELLGQKMPYRFGDRFGKLHLLLGRSHSFSFMVLDTDDRGDIAGTRKTFDGEAISSAATDSLEVSWENRVFGGTYEFRSNRWPLVARVTAGRSTMQNEFGPRAVPQRVSGIESVDIHADVSWLLSAGTIDAGFSRRRSTLNYELDGIFQDYDTSTEKLTELNSYLQASLWLHTDLVRVTPGIHLYSLAGRGRSWFEPRVRVSWYPSGEFGRVTIHGAWGLYHQAVVGLNDERDLGNQFTAWTVAPKNADVPRAMHAIVGGAYRFAPWLNVAVEGFHKTYEALSVPVFSAFPRFTTTLQPADGTANGFDVRLDVTERPLYAGSTLDGYVAYAYSNVEYEAGALRYHPAHDRRHQVTALLNASLNTVSLTVQLQAGSGLPFTESAGFDKWYLLTPDTDVGAEPGVDRIFYAEPFMGRQPSYTRMDVWLERRIENGRTVATLRAGVVNVLNRSNLFYYDLFEFRRVDQLPLIPSVGVKVELR